MARTSFDDGPTGRWRFGVKGPDGARSIGLELPAVVGRSSSADLTVLDAAVSGYHARLTQDGASVRLTDLGSSNGTLVAGERISEAVLRPGDAFLVGETTVSFESGPAGESEAPEDSRSQ